MLFLFLAFSTISVFSQEKYQLSSHILDIAKGFPAPGVTIELEKWSETSSKWEFADRKVTDANGRVKDFLKQDDRISNKGTYKLIFLTAPYFKQQGQKTFYPRIEVIFQITDNTHYHVPITLSPYGYSTYRGS